MWGRDLKFEGLREWKLSLWLWCLCLVILFNFSFQKEVLAITRAYTSPFPSVGNVRNIIWAGLLNGDVGEAYTGLGRWDTATIQVTGTFGASGNVRIEASNNTGTPTWYTVTNITAAGITVINAGYYQVRVNITAGDGATNLTATMVVTESTPDAKNLDDLLDVVIANPLNLHVPQYNSTTSKFENALCSCPGGGGAGGLNTYVQFNDLTAFGGDAGFVYNKTTDTATLGALTLTTGNITTPADNLIITSTLYNIILRSAGDNWVIIDTGLGLQVTNKIGIGLTPTARLHLPAGTATANTAPLKFTSGSLISPTPEPGAVEFQTDNYYGTITTGAVRKTFAFLESPVFVTPNIGVASGTSLSLTGTFDISNANPIFTLTDTDASSADLQIDLNANIVQMRAAGGAANSLMNFNLDRNSIGVGISAGTVGELLTLQKASSNPAIDSVPMSISSGLLYTGTAVQGFMYGILQNVSKSGSGNVTNMLGINCYITNVSGGGTVSNLAAFNSDINVSTATTITNAQHYHVTPASGAGTVTSEVGYICALLTKGTNRTGFAYGLADGTLPTGVFAIYAAGDSSFFGANVAIGATAFGTSADKVLGILNGTAPTTSPVDMIQIFSKDNTEVTPGATLGLRTENAVEAIGTFTESHKLRVWVNGVEYWISLDAV